MFNPKEKYDIFETREFFEDFIFKKSKTLKKRVRNGSISKSTARKEFDMFLNAYQYLQILEKMAKDESFLNDKSFSMEHLYKDERTKNSIQKAIDNIS